MAMPAQMRENRAYVRALLKEKQPEFAAALHLVIQELRAGGRKVAQPLPGGSALHDLPNTGSEDLRVLAFFNGPKAEMHWTKEVWEPGHLTVIGTPNR